MTFPEFLAAYRSGDIRRDAAWRAYAIERAVTPRCVRGALKRLGLAYAGELAMPQFCAMYGVDIEAAPAVLGSWWLWSGIDAGRAMGVPLRRSGEGEGRSTV